MNEIIKKIDEEIEMYKNRISVRQGANYHDESERIIRFEERLNEAIRIKEIIQTEQKEPCHSQSECKYKENDLCNIRKEYGYRELKLPCPKLQKPLTKGDVIREISNNAELAKEIFRFCNELSCNYDFSMAGLLAHLNQPVESEE